MRFIVPSIPIIILCAGGFIAPHARSDDQPTPVAENWIYDRPEPDASIAILRPDNYAADQDKIYEMIAFACKNGDLAAYVQFSSFPSIPTLTQLSVRRADGSVWRWQKPESIVGTPQSGFPFYELQDGDAKALLDAANNPGTLISDGHRSFWNRSKAADADKTKQHLGPCLQ